MKRNILTKQVKTLAATAAVLAAYGLSFPAAIAAATGPANAQTDVGSGYHVPQTHDPAAPPVSRAPLHTGHSFVTAAFGSEGQVNAQSDVGDVYHVPQTHDGAAPPVSRASAPPFVIVPDNSFSMNFGGN